MCLIVFFLLQINFKFYKQWQLIYILWYFLFIKMTQHKPSIYDKSKQLQQQQPFKKTQQHSIW